MRHRKTVLTIGLLSVAVLTARHPTADFRLITHDARDPAPHKIQAALDLGLIGVSILYTWTVDRLR